MSKLVVSDLQSIVPRQDRRGPFEVPISMAGKVVTKTWPAFRQHPGISPTPQVWG